jgi:protein-tyrosine phosphatase
MIDLHCHILPGVDDGPKNLDESLEMVRIFIKAGYRQVVATPHQVPGTTWMLSVEEIRNKLAELNQAMKIEGMELDVLPGMEIAFDPLIPGLLEKGQLLTLGKTSYVLIETPFQQLPLGWEQVVFAILSKGYFILMAHPERCTQLAAGLQLVDRLIESGVYLQVNWDSFLGYHGRAALRMAHYLAENGYIHCLATDSHNPQERHAAHVKLAVAKIKKVIGRDNLQRIASENPLRVLRNTHPLPMMKPDPKTRVKKESKWRFW